MTKPDPTTVSEQPPTAERFPTFWHWLLGGPLISGKPGWRKLTEPTWLLAHGMLGLLAALFTISVPLATVTPYLFGASVFLGLGILLATQTMDSLASDPRRLGKFFARHPEGVLNYIYTFQLAVLVGLITVIYWAFLAFWPFGGVALLKAVGFTLFSVTVARILANALRPGVFVEFGVYPRSRVHFARRACARLI